MPYPNGSPAPSRSHPGIIIAPFMLTFFALAQRTFTCYWLKWQYAAEFAFCWKLSKRIEKMKIAAVTDDGKTISAHFGRARQYKVATVEDGEIKAWELRAKAGHHDFVHEEGDDAGHSHAGEGHGHGDGAQSRHARMFATITDCSAVLARGMGEGAYAGLQDAGIRPIVTIVSDIDEAVRAYVAGRLEDHPEKLH